MKITWYGHACFKLEVGSSVVLFDPFLTGNPVFESMGRTVEEVTKDVTHVALTHGHDDHLGDTVAICQKTGATLIAIVEIALYLNSQGVEKVDPANIGGTVDHEDFKVTLVNAVHSSATVVDGQSIGLGNPCGLIIKGMQGKAVYHMGDTDIFSDMGLINELYQPDVGLVPIGDRFTMGARTAALACKRFFNFSTIIPCHYGTFPSIDKDASQFLAQMDGENVVVMDVGQVIELN